jgi:cytochrome P450
MGRSENLWENALHFNPQRFIDDPKPSPYKFTAFQASDKHL